MNYPVEHRRNTDDPRFSWQFLTDLNELLRKHGYPPLNTEDDYKRFTLYLTRFIYGIDKLVEDDGNGKRPGDATR
jgi:hypothetical protein